MFLGLAITGMDIVVVMTGIGTVSLAGIVVNNAIVMLDYVVKLRKKGYRINDAMITASAVRFRPVILTAVTTVLGLIPIAIGMDFDFSRDNVFIFGAESASFWKSMALAIMYGLGVTTILTLFLLPTLYSLVEGGKERIKFFFNRKK